VKANAYEHLAAPILAEDLHLVPLCTAHEAALVEAFAEDELWTWMLVEKPAGRAAVRAWLDDALAHAAARTQVPWAIEFPSGALAGTTRFLDLRWHDRGLEIGWTLMFAGARGGWANSRAKRLLLERAFETGFSRVQLKTDARNVRSRSAIAAIGAEFEGVLRSYQRRADDTLRDSAMFSIVAEAWPNVRARLDDRAARLFQQRAGARLGAIGGHAAPISFNSARVRA
jgi:RimJ/RimL family protein N-acetyltransferase